MIISIIGSGLGNQLFQYALGRCLAIKNKTELKLDITSCIRQQDSHHSFYRLGVFNIQENFANQEEIKRACLIVEQDFKMERGKFASKVLDCNDNIALDGLWQSERYFIEIRDVLLREFTLKNPLGKISATWKEKILSSTCAVSLHVRHGDYLTHLNRYRQGILPYRYYSSCIRELAESYSGITIFIFSDDMQWCKENFKFDVPTEFVEGCEHDFEEIHLMSLCKHNIIANSTFAWWGAWLNQNPDKKVFSPEPWLRSLWWEDIVPENWKKVPTAYSLGIPPMLSIIIYVEDNLSTINLSLTSAIFQDFPDYDVILIDASTDDSGIFCRQFTKDSRVTLLKVNPYTKKFEAWNKALEIARGDYVLFLTAKDFLLPYATKSLSIVSEEAFKKYANTRENYLTYATYSEYLPNIICSTQRIEEDEGGEININGIPNKKFSLKVDAAFYNLNWLAEFNIPADQKLMSLATNNINNFVSTKFFKRTFIIDNNIRFDGGAADAELLFIIDAFLRTEKITFVSQVFLARLK